MLVESDFLFALTKPKDWLTEEAKAPRNDHILHASIATYAKFLFYFYDEDAGEYTIRAAAVVPNLLEVVPARPEDHEGALTGTPLT